MGIFSALLALCEGKHQSPVDSPHKAQWRGALMFSLISDWTNGWGKNRDAGDLIRHRAHYDVIVIFLLKSWINSWKPSEAYLSHWTMPLLVQVMACRLLDAKPLSEPIFGSLLIRQLEQISVQFHSNYQIYHWRKRVWQFQHLGTWHWYTSYLNTQTEWTMYVKM